MTIYYINNTRAKKNQLFEFLTLELYYILYIYPCYITMLRYVSDLHLEFSKEFMLIDPIIKQIWTFDRIPNVSYYLILAGDIGNPYVDTLESFLGKVSENFDHIYYVPGNHEYYNLDPERPKEMSRFMVRLENICDKFKNISMLSNKSVHLPNGIKIIGTTLWSKIDPLHETQLELSINDYAMIEFEPEKILTVNDTNKLNRQAVKFIKNEIGWAADGEKTTTPPCIVVTHHAPLFNIPEKNQYTADPIYTNLVTSQAFHNDLWFLIDKPIYYWIYGHTHYVSSFEYNNVKIVTNQFGYPNESSTVKFNPNIWIDLDEIIQKYKGDVEKCKIAAEIDAL